MERGFTIIELMIVVALIGIVGSMALPAFQDMIRNNRQVAATNELVAAIHYARSEAITRNQVITICRSNAAQTACGAAGGGWDLGWIVRTSDGEVLRSARGLRGAQSLVSPLYADSVSFRRDGRVFQPIGNDTDRYWMLCDGGQATRRIELDRTGRPAVSNASGSCT
jgi:type IV fimbrial biogenesis protein FimT